jgi:CRISPR-associated endonuclease/helicase Cas3
MPKTDPETKRKRIELVYRLLERHPNGLTEREIADMLNMERRNVNNYLRALEIEGKLYKDGRAWFVLPYERVRLRRFELSPEEAMTLYLATRLLAKQHDKRNESAETALIKLAEVLTGDAGVGHEIHQAALELAHRPGDERYSQVFRTIMQSYIYRRKAAITYHPMNSDPFQTVLSPYLLEPSAIGYATYVIGQSSIVGTLRTYKLERIEQATLTSEEYTVPTDFPGLDILRHAWSIIHGEKLNPVRLRFHPRVTRRVRESRWHPSQDIADDPDNPGGCIWTAQVADLTDLLPWVRGWGADVEVLGPVELREALVNETRRLALLYQVGDVTPPPLYQKLWAKADKRTGKTHPLICHMLDVAQVALALWREVFTASVRAQFAGALGLDEDGAGRLISFWAGLHDLGKASPAFQRKWLPAESELSQAGLAFPQVFARESFSHGTASGYLLPRLLETETGLPRRFARGIARVVGGHHGAWPIPAELQNLKEVQLGGEDWDAVRRDLVHGLAECLDPPSVEQAPSSPTEYNALWALLSGFTSVADWIGSMEQYFLYTDTEVNLNQYAKRSAQRAEHALDVLNWTGWVPPAEPLSFTSLFQVPSPRPMQAQVIELAEHLDRPALVIIEAPTGAGKTEAALYLADHWACTLQQRGLYVAMPTMATSNQMFGRVQAVLNHRYPQNSALPLLVHSQAAWMQESAPPDLDIVDEGGEGKKRSIEAMAWFLPRKRSLLAPFAVGTVDQALLSVLQTRHFFVRLFGLSHKTVIFDEVHAYDTYMSSLFQRLLSWLCAVDASVVLLSATLPEKTRRELLQAYSGTPATDIPSVPYPAITWAADGQIGAVPLEISETRIVSLEWIQNAPEAIAERLGQELQEGGCAAIICNTVARAQQIFRALHKARLLPEEDLILFHARFPLCWRDGIEKKVLDRFGKDGDRPHRAIVVATQVIEQSLDLDFDLMLSDLAPADLLLQRAGRLHRHDRESRPAALNAPRLLVTDPVVENGVPVFDRSDTYVYEPYVLLRSYLALRPRDQLVLPEDTAPLIEAVYGDEDPTEAAFAPPLEEALSKARQRMREHEATHVFKARAKLIATPQADNLLSKSNLGLAEDSPEAHEAFQALTRLGPPSISLVCLHRVGDVLNTEPDGSGQVVNLDHKPDDALTQELVRATVAVSHRDIVNYYRAQQVPPGWREHPLLNRYYVAIFESGLCPLEGSDYTLHLTRQLGLEVLKQTD